MRATYPSAVSVLLTPAVLLAQTVPSLCSWWPCGALSESCQPKAAEGYGEVIEEDGTDLSLFFFFFFSVVKKA